MVLLDIFHNVEAIIMENQNSFYVYFNKGPYNSMDFRTFGYFPVRTCPCKVVYKFVLTPCENNLCNIVLDETIVPWLKTCTSDKR